MAKSTVLLCFFGFLLLFSSILLIAADEDAVEGEDEVFVEDDADEGSEMKKARNAASPTSIEKDLNAEPDLKLIEPSPDADVTLVLTDPVGTKELPSGKLVKFLIGFYNKGERDFIVKYSETSFRYPMDFSYHIQNFTLVKYNFLVEPKKEGTFSYAFYPSENYAGRPLGLVVILRYEDTDGTVFENAVYNETVTITENESGFNPETGFLYVVFACIVVLLLVLGQQFLSKMRRKHGISKKPFTKKVEMGTVNKNEVNFEWIPKEVLNLNKSPKMVGSKNKKSSKISEANKN